VVCDSDVEFAGRRERANVLRNAGRPFIPWPSAGPPNDESRRVEVDRQHSKRMDMPGTVRRRAVKNQKAAAAAKPPLEEGHEPGDGRSDVTLRTGRQGERHRVGAELPTAATGPKTIAHQDSAQRLGQVHRGCATAWAGGAT
jgi:hypothetical protein